MSLSEPKHGPRPIVRAEHVGSLLKPPALRDLFPQVYAGHKTLSPAVLDERGRARLEELERLADRAVEEVVKRQIAIGLEVITDGEMRRSMFTHSLVDALAGFDDSDKEFAFTNERGEVLVPPSGPLVGRQRLRKVDSPAAREVAYVRSLTDYPIKVTFPAASYWFCEPIELQSGVYETQAEFVNHVVEIQRELIADAIAAGADYVQLDWPPYVMMVDPKWAEEFPDAEGKTTEDLLASCIEADNAVLEGIPEGVTKAMHICRGNYKSLWMTEGTLDPIAERLFGELRYDRFLVEWEDTDREGDYSPLRYVPPGPVVTMGVVSSKNPEVESADEIARRIEDAARYLDIDQLALSPQCGFSSTWEGNELAEDSQWRKLELVVEVADRIWS